MNTLIDLILDTVRYVVEGRPEPRPTVHPAALRNPPPFRGRRPRD